MRAVLGSRGIALGLIFAASLFTTGCWERVSDKDQRACLAIIDARSVTKADLSVRNVVKSAVKDWIRDCSKGWMSIARPYRTFPLIEGRLANASDPMRQLTAANATLRRAHELGRDFRNIRRMLRLAVKNGVLVKEEFSYLRDWMKERRLKNTATVRAARAVLKQRRYLS